MVAAIALAIPRAGARTFGKARCLAIAAGSLLSACAYAHGHATMPATRGVDTPYRASTKLNVAIRSAFISRILTNKSGLNNESLSLRSSPGKYSWVVNIGPLAA